MKSANVITSLEITKYMMSVAHPVTTSEIALALQKQYPLANVDIKAIYRRVRSITRSHFVVCEIDKTTGPYCRYKLTSVSDDFFRKNKAIKRDRPEYWSSLQVSVKERQARSDEKSYRVLRLLRKIDNERRAARTGSALAA